MIYITSDLHLSHNKSFCYIPRGFVSVDEMNKAIVKRWNALVNEDDDVYILGDLMLNDNDAGMELLESLNGRLHVVLGNHDTDTRRDLYEDSDKIVEVCGYATKIRYKKYNFYLSHYPTLTSNYDDDKPLGARIINLCGHSHTEDKFADMDKGLIYHCELDAHHCEPVLIDDIIWDIKNYLLHQEACSMAIADTVNVVGTPRAEDAINIQAAVFKYPDIDAYCRDCTDKLECPGPSMDGCPPGKDYKAPRCNQDSMDKKELIMEDYFQGKIPTLKEAVDKIYESLEKDIYNGVMNYIKNHHLRFELSVAWDDDDEFEHEGYYDSADELIERLIHYWEDIQK